MGVRLGTAATVRDNRLQSSAFAYSLSYRDLERMMAERGLNVDHSTIACWVLRTLRSLTSAYGPMFGIRIDPGEWMKPTYAFPASGPTYSEGNTIDFMLSWYRDRIAAKHFLQLALQRVGHLRPRVITVDGHPAYPSVIKELKQTTELPRACRCRPSLLSEQPHRTGSPLYQKANCRRANGSDPWKER